MKKQIPPAPTPRAAALSQSASRFSAGATSAWQRIAGNSPRLAAASHRGPGAARVNAPLAPPGANRVALEPQRAGHSTTPVAESETIRQVGWREVDRAVSMSTKRKYNLFGIGFGPKVPVFETEKIRLPVYQETDREKGYYVVVHAEDVARIKREGLQPQAIGRTTHKVTMPQTVEQFNTKGQSCLFCDEASALNYGYQEIINSYAVIKFLMPEYQEFVYSIVKNNFSAALGGANAMRMR